jgi:hypothetical protein
MASKNSRKTVAGSQMKISRKEGAVNRSQKPRNQQLSMAGQSQKVSQSPRLAARRSEPMFALSSIEYPTPLPTPRMWRYQSVPQRWNSTGSLNTRRPPCYLVSWAVSRAISKARWARIASTEPSDILGLISRIVNATPDRARNPSRASTLPAASRPVAAKPPSHPWTAMARGSSSSDRR